MSLRESTDSIISQWAQDYGKRFSSKERVDACIDLFSRLKDAGYDESEIKENKLKAAALDRMVGHFSKKGQAGIKRWRSVAEEDFNDAFNIYFKPKEGNEVEREYQAEPVLDAVEPVRQQEDPVNTPDINKESAEQEDSESDYIPKVRDEHWRIKFQEGVETTPVENEEEFMARMGLK